MAFDVMIGGAFGQPQGWSGASPSSGSAAAGDFFAFAQLVDAQTALPPGLSEHAPLTRASLLLPNSVDSDSLPDDAGWNAALSSLAIDIPALDLPVAAADLAAWLTRTRSNQPAVDFVSSPGEGTQESDDAAALAADAALVAALAGDASLPKLPAVPDSALLASQDALEDDSQDALSKESTDPQDSSESAVHVTSAVVELPLSAIAKLPAVSRADVHGTPAAPTSRAPEQIVLPTDRAQQQTSAAPVTIDPAAPSAAHLNDQGAHTVEMHIETPAVSDSALLARTSAPATQVDSSSRPTVQPGTRTQATPESRFELPNPAELRFVLQQAALDIERAATDVSGSRRMVLPFTRPVVQESNSDAILPRPAFAFTVNADVPLPTVDAGRNPGSPADRDTPSRDQHLGSASRTPVQSARTTDTALPVGRFDAMLGDAARVSAETAAAAPSIPNEDQVASSIVQSMRLQWRNGIGTAVVNLEPDYLGAVRIALHVERGNVTATLHAANADVRAWIEANESLLRQGLADQGLTLERLIVADEASNERQQEQDGRRQPRQDEPEPKRQARSSDPNHTFEIVV